MIPSFTTPLPTPAHRSHSSLLLCRPPQPLSLARHRRCTPSPTPVMVTSRRGWAETRLTWASRETIPPPRPDLPGVHFANPPGITAKDLLDIIYGRTPDAWVNEIMRSLLGWRQLESGRWSDAETDTAWRQMYSRGPPNFIGVNGDYRPEVDRMVKLTVQRLSRSVPPEYKAIIKEVMRPLGFPGWKVSQLTPNLTRRAQCVNWILYWYRVHYPHYAWSLDD